MSEVFIVEAVIDEWLDLDASFRLLEMQELRVENHAARPGTDQHASARIDPEGAQLRAVAFGVRVTDSVLPRASSASIRTATAACWR